MKCSVVDCMPGLAGNCIHDQFLERTDKRNVKGIIDVLVKKAMKANQENLELKRKKLLRILNEENRIYSEEFAEIAKARIERDIKKRRDKLMGIHYEYSGKSREGVEMKRVQDRMINCTEIRDALRKKESLEARAIQREQMIENERSIARAREQDLYWWRIQKARLDDEDEKQIKENCLKKQFHKQIKFTLDKQIEEQNARKALEEKEKQAEKERINKLIEELRLEEFERKHKPFKTSTIEYRAELLEMIEENRRIKQRKIDQATEDHRELMRAIQEEESKGDTGVIEAKKAHNRALLEFIAFAKNMRRLQAEEEKMLDDQVETVRRIDACTKYSLGKQSELRAQETAKYYEDLRRQICEQYEKRRLDEYKRREDKMFENPFGRFEKTRAQVLAEQRCMRRGLKEQMETLRRYQAEEAKQYKESLSKALEDPKVCHDLAVKYLSEGVDYLKPHPNWSILLGPCKKYESKSPMPEIEVPKELMPSKQKCGDICTHPCGCILRPFYDSGKSQQMYKGEIYKGIKTKYEPKIQPVSAFMEHGYTLEYK